MLTTDRTTDNIELSVMDQSQWENTKISLSDFTVVFELLLLKSPIKYTRMYHMIFTFQKYFQNALKLKSSFGAHV